MLELAQEAGRMFGPRIGHMYNPWMGPVMMLIVIGLLVAGAITIVRMLSNRQGPASGPRGPIQIL